MNVSLETLRRTMHQRADVNTVRLATDTYLEESRDRAFDPGDVAELFHENSKYVPGLMELVMRSVGEFDQPSMRYAEAHIDPDYPGHELIDLPEPTPPDRSLADVLRARRSDREFGSEALAVSELSQLLRYAAGVTDTRDVDGEGTVRKHLRSYPSAGALYPVELYVVIRSCGELDPGVYYYVPRKHGLRALRTDDEPAIEEALVATGNAIDVENVDVVIALTGAFPRSKSKYGPRGYRYVLQESGHLAGNLQLVAGSLGLRSVPMGGFYDDPLNDLLGIDGVDEAALYVVLVGTNPDRGVEGR